MSTIGILGKVSGKMSRIFLALRYINMFPRTLYLSSPCQFVISFNLATHCCLGCRGIFVWACADLGSRTGLGAALGLRSIFRGIPRLTPKPFLLKMRGTFRLVVLLSGNDIAIYSKIKREWGWSVPRDWSSS